MTGQQFRDVLKQNDFFLSDFAAYANKSRWWAQRITHRQREVAPRWVVLFSEFLQAHNLNLNDFYPKVVFDDTNIDTSGRNQPQKPRKEKKKATEQVAEEEEPAPDQEDEVQQ